MAKKLLIILLIVVVGGGAVIGGTFAWRYWQVSKQEEKPEPEVEVPTDWKAYRNEDYGFEIKYPKEWEVKIVEASILFIDITKTDILYPDGLVAFTINILDTSFDSIHRYFEEKFQDRSEELVPEYTELAVNNTPALRFFDPISMGGCPETIIFLRDSKLYELNRTGPTCEYSNELFDQILSTFRFIEVEVPADWKTYRNEEYGYEIEYSGEFVIQKSSYGIEFIPSEYQDRTKCEPSCPTFMFIHIEEIDSEVSLENWIKEHYHLEKFEEFQITPEESNWWIDYIKKVTIGKDIQGYLVHLWRQAWGECHYYVEHKNIVINIVRGRIGLDWSSCSDDPTFNQMLPTLRFIE